MCCCGAFSDSSPSTRFCGSFGLFLTGRSPPRSKRVAAQIRSKGGKAMAGEDSGVRYHVRFTPWERYLHVIVFSTFIGLALTGPPLRFSSESWAERFAR